MYVSKSPSRDIMDLINGFDIFNSEFLARLDLLVSNEKLITKNEYRLDLLTREFYGDWDNYGILGIKNRIINRSELTIGSSLQVPTQRELDDMNLSGG